jgi:hypothetical protein
MSWIVPGAAFIPPCFQSRWTWATESPRLNTASRNVSPLLSAQWESVTR